MAQLWLLVEMLKGNPITPIGNRIGQGGPWLRVIMFRCQCSA